MNKLEHPYGNPSTFLNLSTASAPYWKIGKEGPDLVFVHGWPLDSRTWRRSVELLSDTHTCHLFDLPGAGLCRWNPDTPLGVSTFSLFVEEVLEHLELREFYLIGHDSGGGFARMVASRLPGRVAGLVLGNTETPKRYSWLFRSLFALGTVPLADTLTFHLMGMKGTRALCKLTSPKYHPELDRELNKLFLKPLGQERSRLDAAFQFLKSAKLSEFDVLEAAHAKIEAPVMLVWGKNDPWFPLKHAEEMTRSFAGEVELKVVEKAGLLVHEEHPEVFASAVREFVAENDLMPAVSGVVE